MRLACKTLPVPRSITRPSRRKVHNRNSRLKTALHLLISAKEILASGSFRNEASDDVATDIGDSALDRTRRFIGVSVSREVRLDVLLFISNYRYLRIANVYQLYNQSAVICLCERV